MIIQLFWILLCLTVSVSVILCAFFSRIAFLVLLAIRMLLLSFSFCIFFYPVENFFGWVAIKRAIWKLNDCYLFPQFEKLKHNSNSLKLSPNSTSHLQLDCNTELNELNSIIMIISVYIETDEDEQVEQNKIYLLHLCLALSAWDY